MNNLIEFPKNRIVRQINETVNRASPQALQNMILAYIDYMVEKNMNGVFNALEVVFKPRDKAKFLEDFGFAAEALKSALLRDLGVGHPIQGLVDVNSGKSEWDFSDEADNDNDNDPTPTGSGVALKEGALLQVAA